MNDSTAGGPIQDVMSDCLNRHGWRRALVDASETLSYAELGDRVHAASCLLRGLLAGKAPRHIEIGRAHV